MSHLGSRPSRIIVVLTVAVAAAVHAQYQCSYLANINVTLPDLAPPKFVVSSYDCCVACSDFGPDCVASVYSNFYCHLKSSVSEQVVSTGPTLILQLGRTPAPQVPTTTQTPIPPPPLTPTPSTSAPPTPTSPTPSPPTPAPSPSGSVVIIREVQCQYSDKCDRMQDYSCYTTAFYNSTCYGTHLRYCSGDEIVVETYSSSGCSGVIKTRELEAANVCAATPDETYVGHYCDEQSAPLVGTAVLRTVCPYGCDDNTECTAASFTTGVCLTSNPFSSMPGSSTMAWCFPEYVLYNTYGSIDCSGPIASGRVEPIGSKCFLDNNQEHIQNICGSP